MALARLDVRQWRVVLGTPRNVYVVCAGVAVAVVMCHLGTESTIPETVSLSISSLVGAASWPVLEILDLPITTYFLVVPPGIAVIFLLAVKYDSTGVMGFSGVVDRPYILGTHTGTSDTYTDTSLHD